MKHTRKHLVLSIIIAQATLGSQFAYSQLEEVVVTAERREASLQDTDIAITAMSSETLGELGVSTFGDIGSYVPNVVTHETPGNAGTAVMIRGLKNAETIITFEPKVAVYLDSVLIAKNTGSAFDIVDVERIEVLRGPQGTLYGRNTVGGAINLVTKKPYDVLGGNISVTLGDYGQQDFKGTLNIPLTDTLALKGTVASLTRDGYWKNQGPSGQDELGDKDRTAAHLQLQWQPSDRLSLLYTYDMTDADEAPTPRPSTYVNNNFTAFLPYLSLIEPYLEKENPDSVNIEFESIQKLEVEGHSLTAELDLSDDLQLVSITAYRETENTAWGDNDGTPFLIRGSIAGSEHEQLTQEFRLVGSAMDSKLQYVAGLFYMNEEGDTYNGNIIDNQGSRNGNSIGIVSFENDIWAVFGEGTYSLTEQLDLTLGIRYTEEEREMHKTNFSFPVGDQYFPTAADAPDAGWPTTVGPETWDDVSGTVSLSYRWNDDLMSYAKVAKGYASGGFNARATSPEALARAYDEETLISYELGLKSTWLDNRLLINAAAFYSDYSDLQVNQFDPVTASNNIGNAGDAEINGAELEVIASLSANWELGLSYGYLNPKYKTFIAADGKDLSRSFWAHTPEHNAHAYVRYTLDDALLGGNLSARLDYMFQDENNFLTFYQPGWGEPHYQKPFSHINARITLNDLEGAGSGRFSVSLWGSNLTDESWRTTGINFVTYTNNSYAPPRTYGVDLKYSF